MKNIITLTLSFLFFTTNILAHTNDVIVNHKNSTIKWTGSKPTGDHSGTINISSGKLVFDHGTLVGGQFIIDMTSIACTDLKPDEGGDKLVRHLKNEHFFDVEKFPTAKIVITRADAMPDGVYKISANLTIKDITHPIIFSAHVTYKKNNFLATANINIDRTKWDVVYKSGSVFKDLGDKFIHDEIKFDLFLLSEK